METVYVSHFLGKEELALSISSIWVLDKLHSHRASFHPGVLLMYTSKLLGKSDEWNDLQGIDFPLNEGAILLLSMCYETIAVLAGESRGS